MPASSIWNCRTNPAVSHCDPCVAAPVVKPERLEGSAFATRLYDSWNGPWYAARCILRDRMLPVSSDFKNVATIKGPGRKGSRKTWKDTVHEILQLVRICVIRDEDKKNNSSRSLRSHDFTSNKTSDMKFNLSLNCRVSLWKLQNQICWFMGKVAQYR